MDKEPLNDAGVPVIVRWDAPTTAWRSNSASTSSPRRGTARLVSVA